MTETQSHVKKLFSQTVIYGFGILLNKSAGFILLPVYTKFFPPEQMGLFALVLSLSMFLSVIYMFGMETSFMKFFIDAKESADKSIVYSSSLITLFVTSLGLSLLLLTYAESISDFLKLGSTHESIFLVKLLAVYLFIDTLSRFPLLLLRAELKSKTYSAVNLISFIVNIVVNIILIVILEKGIESIFYGYIISSFVTFVAGLALTRKYFSLSISPEKVKQLFIFGNKFIYIGIFLLLIDISDRYFLNYFFDEETVGIYSANYRLASVMGFMIAAFKFSWTPYFLNLSSNPENKEIISKVFLYFTFTGLFLFLFFSAIMENAVKLTVLGYQFLNVDYWGGLKIVPLLLLAYLFSGIFAALNAAPFFKNSTISLLLISFIGFAVNMLLNFLFIPLMDITGAALATLVTYLAMSLMLFFYSQKIYKLEFPWKKIALTALATLIFFALTYFGINNLKLDPLIAIAINCILNAIYLFLMLRLKIINRIDFWKHIGT